MRRGNRPHYDPALDSEEPVIQHPRFATCRRYDFELLKSVP